LAQAVFSLTRRSNPSPNAMAAVSLEECQLKAQEDLEDDEDLMVKTHTGSTHAGDDADDVDASDDDDESELDLSDTWGPPPGLSKPDSEVPATSQASAPSIGSAHHAAGLCKPCAWFWKTQGCSNGQECEHCHLCPKGEVRRRKKGKKQMTKTLTEGATLKAAAHIETPFPQELPNLLPKLSPQLLRQQEAVIRQQQSQLHFMQMQLMQQQHHLQLLAGAPMLARQAPPTKGSALHGTGSCKPCAWHWKPGGCEAGASCSFCHLCPPGEIKMRKKIKVALMGPS